MFLAPIAATFDTRRAAVRVLGYAAGTTAATAMAIATRAAWQSGVVAKPSSVAASFN